MVVQASRCFAFAQHDKTQRGDASTSLSMTYSVNEIATSGNALLAMTEYSISLAMMEYSITLAMTYYNT